MICFGGKPKKYRCTIMLLDETDIVHEIDRKTTGQDVMEHVFKHLNLLETAYFGLRYVEKSSGESRWLDPSKRACKQLKDAENSTFYFGVKFYASDPCKLQEEITRYQFVLQIKQDISQGRLPVSFELGAELFALSLQAELGDYDSGRHDKHYVSEFRFLPHQTPELEEKVAEIHKTLSGKVPSVVEMTFLEKVRWLDMYGVDLHIVMGEDKVEYYLCLTPSGVIIMKNGAKVSNYFWPRITKAFFKGKYFMLRVRNKINEENTYAFELRSKQSCKYLWKCCVEHHAFFRLTQVKDIAGLPVNIFRFGSKHRYSGRTEQQIKADMKRLKRPPPAVVRVPSRRYPKRVGEPDGAEAEKKNEEPKICVKVKAKDDLSLSNSNSVTPLYRSISTPAELSCTDSSNVTKIAPWEDPNQKGLFSNSSRQSLCSSHGSERRHRRRSHSRRRLSVDSELSSDYRKSRHRSRRSSDNDSDISKSSRGSRGSKSSRGSHRRYRSDSQENLSSDSCTRKRSRRRRRHGSGSKGKLVDSQAQWKMVEKQQQQNAWLQSAVVRDLSNRKSGYMNSGIDTESEAVSNHRRKHRRHSRSRSRSPDVKQSITSEVKKHITYGLVDASGLTEEEKKDIKYTKIETNEDVVKVRYSPAAAGKRHYKLDKVPSRSSLDKIHCKKEKIDEGPPPPYTPYANKNVESPNSHPNGVTSSKVHRHSGKKRKDALSTASRSTAAISDSSSSSIITSNARHKNKSSKLANGDAALSCTKKHVHGQKVS